MTSWDLGSLARATGAQIFGGALPEGVEAVGTDSRSLPPRCLFVALRGDRFDGHDFLAGAVSAGAVAVLVDSAGASKAASLGVPRLVVNDTLEALGDIAGWVRRRIDKPVVGLTGSNGKTTTKEMLASILGQRGSVHKNAGNFNNLVGLPLTILAWPADTWAAVLEMGMNATGEIARLTEIAGPDVGLVTNVGPAHLEGLGTIEAIGRAKGELYAGLGAEAIAVVNADDPVIAAVCGESLAGRPVLRFGAAVGCDVRVVSVTTGRLSSRVTLEVDGRPVEVELPVLGTHNAMNAAGAAAAAMALGVDRDEIASGLLRAEVPGGRLRILRDARPGVHVVDDTYNANPASMRAAFAVLGEIADGRRVAVLGDMFELGEEAAALHREVGESAATSGVAWVLALGPNAEQTASGARDAGAEAAAFDDAEALERALELGLRPGDWLVVKGSRGMRMERIVEYVTGGKV